jgi:non-ribosomal peptide synthetase component F
MQWMQAEFPLTADDRVVQRTRCGFDASVWEFYAPLLAGAGLVVPRPAEQSDAAELIRVIQAQQVTILQLVPSLLRILLDETGFEDCRSLRRIFCGGEPLTVELRDRCLAALPSELCNLYGPARPASMQPSIDAPSRTRSSVSVTEWTLSTIVSFLSAVPSPIPRSMRWIGISSRFDRGSANYIGGLAWRGAI